MDFEHGGNIWEFNRDIIDFSANINPLGVPESVKTVIFSNVDEVIFYPDPQYRELKNALSAVLGVSIENITINSGATGVIYDLVKSLKPSIACVVVPSFSEYEKALRIMGVDITFLYLKEEDAFALPLNLVEKCISKVDVIFLANPNNPTGNLFDVEKVLYLVRKAGRYGTFVVIDEAFIDWVPQFSLVKQAGKMDNLFVIRSLTKFFAIPGMRVGYGIGRKGIVMKMESVRQPWVVGVLSQVAAISALKDDSYIKRSLNYMIEERARVSKRLLLIDALVSCPGAANFLLLKLKKPPYAVKLKEILSKEGLLIRSCHNFRGLSDDFIRVAIRKREENDILLRKFKEIWKE